MRQPPYKILFGLIVLSAVVISRIHFHLEELSGIRANSLESANGYVNVLLRLTEEMEWTLSHPESDTEDSAKPILLPPKRQ